MLSPKADAYHLRLLWIGQSTGRRDTVLPVEPHWGMLTRPPATIADLPLHWKKLFVPTAIKNLRIAMPAFSSHNMLY